MKPTHVIVCGPEVVGPFRSSEAASEWADAFIGDSALRNCTPHVVELTNPLVYEREVADGDNRSPWVDEWMKEDKP